MRRTIIGVIVAAFTLLVPLSIAAANPRGGINPGEVVIEPGATLWQIAVAHDVTLEALLAANPDLNPYALSIGAVVRIPDYSTALLKDPRERGTSRNAYTIQAGDDLWGIALRHDVAFEDLLAANPEIDPYALTVGTTIVVPGAVVSAEPTAVPVSAGTIEYVVQPDDSLWTISRQHEISMDILLALNVGIDPYALAVGEVILLPRNGAPPVQTAPVVPDASDSAALVAPLAEDGATPSVVDELAASLNQFLQTTGDQIAAIVPLEEVVGQIILPTEAPLIPELVTAPLGETAANTAAETAPVVDAANLTSNIIPITVSLPDNFPVQQAALAVNGFDLAYFTEAPFSYELDMSLLAAGAYSLSFTATTTGSASSTGELLFEIVYLNANPNDPKLSGSAAQTNRIAANAPRQIILNGSAVTSLDLSFSAEAGLMPVVPDLPAVPDQPNELLSILTRPVSLIPEPIREMLMTPRPTESAVIILIMTLTLLPQGIFTLYWMMYTWNNPAAAEKYRSPKEFYAPQQSFTAIIPARHEADVIRQTIMAVDRINYPDHLKEVLVMVRDEDDDETIEATRQTIADIGKDNIHLITFTDGPRNKPNGLNKGLRVATKDVICVFDAEDEPHEDIYNVINTVMLRDDADVVQSGVQLMNFRSSWFSAFNCLEYFFWFKSGLHCFTHAFRVTPLGGNTVFFKKFWLDKVGGWDLNCLTEDADVGIRLTQAGAKIQIVYDEKHATQEETPATVDSFIKQRTRWSQGFYQVFFKGDWLRLPEMRQRITAVYILLNSLMQAATLLYLPIGIFIALTQQIAVPIALLSYFPIFVLILQMVTNLIGIREFTAAYNMKLPFLFSLRMLIAYYPYQLLMAAASFRAVFRFLGQQQSWEKTTHANLHRQSSAAR